MNQEVGGSMAAPGGGPSGVVGGAAGARAAVQVTHTSEPKVLDKRRLQGLVKNVDPLEQLDDDVEEVNMIFYTLWNVRHIIIVTFFMVSKYSTGYSK